MSPDTTPAGEVDAARDSDLPAPQHAALRRIAALAATGAPAREHFNAVVREIIDVLALSRGWLFRYESGPAMSVLASVNFPPFPAGSRWPLDGPSVAATICDTRRPARLDDYSALTGTIARRVREEGVQSVCGVPIFVDGGIWGGIGVSAEDDRLLPADTIERLAAFTELVAGVISSAATRDRLATLADHQTSLRRVATLVAEEEPAAELFAAVTAEATRVLGVPAIVVSRYEGGAEVVVVASRNARRFTPGSRWALDEPGVAERVYATGRPARIDDYSGLSGRMAAGVRDSGLGSVVGVPIMVEGRIWGVGCAATQGTEALPAAIEDRLRDFTDLVGIAIANAESRQRPRRLAEEQAALRRVATLVAEGAAPAAVFSAVAREVARILDVAAVTVVRFESSETSVVVASHRDAGFPVGSRWPLDGPSLSAMVFRSGLPARLDDHEDLPGPVAAAARASGVRSGVAVPITVDGRVWGMIAVGLRPARATLPAHAGMLSSRLVLSAASAQEIEQRLAAFTELLATAIANSEAQAEVARLAEEQAALRRVATLVAQGMPSEAFFGAVCDEVQALAGTDACVVVRFEADVTVTVMGTNADRHAVGARLEADPDYVVAEVHRTRRAARFDTDDPAAPGMPEIVRAERIRSGLASPIVVEGELWGAITTASRDRRLAAGMERRLADFTELAATAISNLQARSELAASRARIAAAADDERRRVVRDLHDGAQQRLVHTVITLKLAQQALAKGAENGPLLVRDALGNAERAMAEVRELAHGILPAVLIHGGLRAGIDALGSRTPVPVEIDVSVGRLPAPVEASAYFVVAEALTNVAKHASARHAEVVARIEDGTLRVEVRDDGVGGASPSGTGLVGLVDRLAVLDGRLEVDSPPGAGTRLTAAIPLPRSDRPAGA